MGTGIKEHVDIFLATLGREACSMGELFQWESCGKKATPCGITDA